MQGGFFMYYDREKAIAYAHKWALGRNPAYFNFDGMGGDCTNFISQCLHAGGAVMNYARDVGWYYTSPDNRAAAWSGVEYLCRFLTESEGIGPYASFQPLREAHVGDVIQLSFDGNTYSHSLLVVSTQPEILIATHTDDSDHRPLSSYMYELARLLHIEGIRI